MEFKREVSYANGAEKIDFIPCLREIREIAAERSPTITKISRLSDKIVDDLVGDCGWHRSKYARLRLDLGNGTFIDKEFRIDRNCDEEIQIRARAALTVYASRELLGRRLAEAEWIVRRVEDMVMSEIASTEVGEDDE